MIGTKPYTILLQEQASDAQSFHRIRSRGKWLSRWELLVVLLLWLIFAFSFKLSSPVHGQHPTKAFPMEVFEQDSKYIIDALVDGEQYPINPQLPRSYGAGLQGLAPSHPPW